MRFIISNTTEAGIAFNEDDRLEDSPQKSFPDKLLFSLASMIRFYRGEKDEKTIDLKDEAWILEMYKRLWSTYDGSEEKIRQIAEEVLAQEGIWKMNLNTIDGLTDKVVQYLTDIEKLGIHKALEEVMG